MQIKCVIVDDDPFAVSVLEDYISSSISLELICCFTDTITTQAFLQQNQVDLIFLDIKMQDFAMENMLETEPSPPWIIITSSYAEFAVDSFEHPIIDILLKPITPDRFLQAVNNIATIMQVQPGTQSIDPGNKGSIEK